MPTFCRPVEEGGVGFDYRLQMAIADIFIMSDASPKPLVQHHASHVLQAAG